MTETEVSEQTFAGGRGQARMVDISDKSSAPRTALAEGRVLVGEEAFRLVAENRVRKGDVLTVAQVAGILGAKQTSTLVPLCHDVVLQNVEIHLEMNEAAFSIDIHAFVRTQGPTGVEMEAMTAVMVAALTVYDMCKSVTREVAITDVRLLAKTGGRSGDYRRGL
jgi:cyclic pyranopterin monophosphate synthase